MAKQQTQHKANQYYYYTGNHNNVVMLGFGIEIFAILKRPKE